MGDSEYVTCPTCGMGWPTRALCERCAFSSHGPDVACGICHGTGEAGLTPAHKCPEPFSYEKASALASFHAASGVPVSQRTKAQIKLGLASRART